MAMFDELNGNPYKPPVLKPSLAQWDNYQIYTLVCMDRTFFLTRTKYFNVGSQLTFTFGSNNIASMVPYSPPKIENESEMILRNNFLAFQSFAPKGVKVNFLSYINTYHE